MDGLKAQLDAARKEPARRRKKTSKTTASSGRSYEGQLYQVKTNKEYSAVLPEIEEVKQEKSRSRRRSSASWSPRSGSPGEVKEAESLLRSRESQGKGDEAVLAEKLRGVEMDMAVVRSERADLTRGLPVVVLADYDKVRHRGTAVAEVVKPNFCGGCRVTITPQRLQELRQQSAFIHCESCGRYLYYQP